MLLMGPHAGLYFPRCGPKVSSISASVSVNTAFMLRTTSHFTRVRSSYDRNDVHKQGNLRYYHYPLRLVSEFNLLCQQSQRRDFRSADLPAVFHFFICGSLSCVADELRSEIAFATSSYIFSIPVLGSPRTFEVVAYGLALLNFAVGLISIETRFRVQMVLIDQSPFDSFRRKELAPNLSMSSDKSDAPQKKTKSYRGCRRCKYISY